jgi:hypothetical protein
MAPLLMRSGTRKLSDVARHVVVPKGIVSSGWPSVRDKCHDLGIVFDPWQEGAARLILSKRADGRYAATVDGVVISIPRQVGKTFTIGAIIFALCILHPGLTVLWTAHRTRTANETFRSMQGMSKRGKIAPHVANVYRGSGNEAVEFVNGSRIMFGAREQGFGRGFAGVDVEVFDEAQILTDRALDDMVAATNQSKFPAGALLFFMGTPPRPIDPGEAFTRMRSEALAGETEDMVYVEFSAEKGADPNDTRQWALANPSFPDRTPAEAMLRMKKKLTTESFLREGLGIWDDLSGSFVPIPMDVWEHTTSDVRPDGDPVFFVSVAREMRSASIAVAAAGPDGPHVELADHRPGVAWLTGRVGELVDRYPGASVGAYAAGPVRSWVPALSELGVDLRLLSVPETVSACAHLKKLADDLAFTHSRDQRLVDSLEGAARRELDGGGWVWDWKASTGDLAPLAAVTGALWLLAERPAYDLLESFW